MTRPEFWPDYEGALLHADGAPVELETLGLPAELVERARRWAGAYDDAKLDPERRDEPWVAAGRALFPELRRELAASRAGDLRLGRLLGRTRHRVG